MVVQPGPPGGAEQVRGEQGGGLCPGKVGLRQKSWRAPPKNVELMPQHQDLGFQLLSRVSRAGIRLGSWESARARLVSPAQASLPRSWPTPELHIRNAAAGTRIISAAGIRLGQRKSVRSFKGIFCHDISEFESSHPSASSCCRGSPGPEFGSDPGNPRELGWCRPRKHPCRDPGLRPSCISATPQLERE
jgi:hypothetical protein